jgi:AAA domain, putative AbiEii toxin, Type IV TA system
MANASPPIDNPSGSVWHRWEPHIHAPGTVLNDQFGGGASAWDEFLSRIERADPPIRALGVTDYYSLQLYERAVEEKRKGRLSGIDLLFPNVEMRLAVAAKGTPINLHLLISPDDPEHVEQARRLLRELTFGYPGETYRCSREDLIRLGRAFDRSATDEVRALEVGTNQFKVNPDELFAALTSSAWAHDNILVAVAGSNRDGTAQLQSDQSLAATRKKLEASANIIFASQPKQREFWLGRGVVSVEQLKVEWGGCKPCLHGSDAHDHEAVGKPSLDRFSWIKGDLRFEALRQACIEPEGRAFVGPAPPLAAMPSRVIDRIHVSRADWTGTPTVLLNSGLVAIIGARGSGKTALVEMIAASAYALPGHVSDRSFLMRASPLLGNAEATLTWAEGEPTEEMLASAVDEIPFETARVQYLSQKFVDQLCSSDGLADELVAEIERVVFEAHPPEDRLGAVNFAELRQSRTTRAQIYRERQQERLSETSAALVAEIEKKHTLSELRTQRDEKRASIEQDKRDRLGLVGGGQADRTQRLEAVSRAIEQVRGRIDRLTRRHQSLIALQAEVADFRKSAARTHLRRWKESYVAAGLTSDQWEAFDLDFKGEVDWILSDEIKKAATDAAALKGPAAGEPGPADETAREVSVIAAGADLGNQTLSLLLKEQQRVQALIGIDQANRRKYLQLTEKITKGEAELERFVSAVESAETADTRIAELGGARREAYAGVFEAIVAEEQALAELYAPLADKLQGQSGALAKLSFSVRRNVDIGAWAKAGEELLDLRAGPFRLRGTLAAEAEKVLGRAWRIGTAEDVSAAMTAFRDTYQGDLREHAPERTKDRKEMRTWSAAVGRWLHSTEHIKVTYGVRYDGVEIEQLSPGTRGIVLLLLYLAIDREDDRPLIIDQPEENLDPKSIFDELVWRFREAKQRRQIIIVTHNANLVVNTDADQVIVASSGAHRPGQLPLISYASGGLENPEIRRQVCEILEGGAAAFIERAKRLRVDVP